MFYGIFYGSCGLLSDSCVIQRKMMMMMMMNVNEQQQRRHQPVDLHDDDELHTHAHTHRQTYIRIQIRTHSTPIYAVSQKRLMLSVTWTETVGLRTRPVWGQKWSWSWSCRSDVALWNTVLHASRHNDLEDHNKITFQVLFIVSLFCTWKITTVEIKSVVHLFKS